MSRDMIRLFWQVLCVGWVIVAAHSTAIGNTPGAVITGALAVHAYAHVRKESRRSR